MPPTAPSLGTLIRIGNSYLFGHVVDLHLPGIVLVALVLSVNLLATGCATRSIRSCAENIMALLNIDDIRIEFPSRRGTMVAVDGVSLSLEKGEILGVVGESGAGKSTIGNAVIGLLEAPHRWPAARCCSTANASTR